MHVLLIPATSHDSARILAHVPQMGLTQDLDSPSNTAPIAPSKTAVATVVIPMRMVKTTTQSV